MIHLENLGGLNKKGVAGKIITSFPVMILIFFIIVIYIISAAVLYKVKGAPSSLAIEGVELDNILLKEIVIGEKRALLIDSLIMRELQELELKDINEKMQGVSKEPIQELKDKKRKILDNYYLSLLRDAIFAKMKQENNLVFNGAKSCFILIKLPLDVVVPEEKDIQLGGEDMFLKFENGEGKFDESILVGQEIGSYYDAGLLNRARLHGLKDGKNFEINVYSYYGKCYDNKELDELIKRRKK